MPRADVPSLALHRLSTYLRCLRLLEAEGTLRISSQQLARRFHLSAPKIRKDLARFGDFGIRGVGYDVPELLARIETVLGLTRERLVILVGAGNLGRALIGFPGLRSATFRIAAVFDVDPEKVGQRVGDLTVGDSAEMPSTVARLGAQLAILAVPPEAAQENYDLLVEAGIRGVLNFAPIRLVADPRARVRSVDLVVFLEELSFFAFGSGATNVE